MSFTVIRKRPKDYVGANLQDYDACVTTFTWAKAQTLLDGLPQGGLNIAHEAVDRHVLAGRGGKLALRWIGRNNRVQDFSYENLQAATNRFANVLAQRDIAKGQRVFSLLGRTPELYIAALGTLKNGSVFSPLFSAFGPEPIKARMTIGDAKALITTEAFYRRKIEPSRKEFASLEHVFLIDCSDNPPVGTTDLAAVMAAASDSFETVWTSPEDMALLHFTSGTTGRPKGAVHVHQSVVAHHVTGKLALDLHPDDIFWCTADPGWVTGTPYGIISPLTNGVTLIIDQAEFDAERWYRILEEQKVNVWYTAPTAIRMLMKVGSNIAKGFDLSSLRFMASVGEPLNPEAVVWGREAFGMPFHDNWWQTETGGIMIANYLSMDVKPGAGPGFDLPSNHRTCERHVPSVTKPRWWRAARQSLPRRGPCGSGDGQSRRASPARHPRASPGQRHGRSWLQASSRAGSGMHQDSTWSVILAPAGFLCKAKPLLL